MTDTIIAAFITGAVAAVISAITNIVMTTINNNKLTKMISLKQSDGVASEGKSAGNGMVPVDSDIQKLEVLKEILMTYLDSSYSKETEIVKKKIYDIDDFSKAETLVQMAFRANSYNAFLSNAQKML